MIGPGAIPNPVAGAAATRPDDVALVADRTLTWQELAAAAARKARQLGALGLRRGDVVGLSGRRTADWIVTAHAIGWLDAVLAPIAAAPAPHARRAAAVGLGCAALVESGATPSIELLVGPRVEAPSRTSFGPADWPLDQARLAVLTSGTTAVPGAVRLTTAQLLFSAFGSAIRLGLERTDRWLHCLPLHAMGGLAILFRGALYGTATELAPCFDAEAVAAALHSGRISMVSLTPRMLAAVLDARPGRAFPGSLRCVLVGGGPTPDAVTRRCEALGVPLARTWGMTEAASQICTEAPGAYGRTLPPLPFTRVTEEATGLVVHGPVVGGRLQTGDVGVVEPTGVRVLGRTDDVIISGGAKIHPQHIEAALTAHPAVADAAVVGVTDPVCGQRPVAYVVRAGDVEVPGLRAWCGRRLRRLEVPDRFVFVDTLSRDAQGKLRRRLLRQQIELGHGGQERVRDIAGREAGHLDEGVAQPHRGAQLAVGVAHDGVGEGHRTPADTLDPRLDTELVADPHGPTEAGLGVHERHPEAEPIEDIVKAREGAQHDLVEAVVGVLEGAVEEGDASAIHMVEADRNGVIQGHERRPHGSIR